jgi:hypothetical protein
MFILVEIQEFLGEKKDVKKKRINESSWWRMKRKETISETHRMNFKRIVDAN